MFPYNVTVEIDLVHDWNEFLISQFKRFPFLDESEYLNIPVDKLSILYFNWFYRLIQPVKRKVHYSKEFICPANLKAGLKEVVRKIQSGHELIAHQSRNLKKLKFNDGLFNDWGLQHLHLGTEIEEDGFVTRNGDVLYILFDNENAYLIQVMDHKSFSKLELMRIVHRNWPETISKHRAVGFDSLAYEITDNDVHLSRKEGSNIFIEVDGIIYFPTGGGITSSKKSVSALRHSDFYFFRVKNIEKKIKTNLNQYVQDAIETLGYRPKIMQFKLRIHDDNAYVVVSREDKMHVMDFGKLNQ
jgi:hypothetical protein